MDERANKIERRLHWTNGAVAELYADHIDPETGEITAENFPQLLAALLEKQDANKDDAINEIKTRAALNDARRAEIDRIKKSIERDEKTIEQLKAALLHVLAGEKFKSPVGSVSYRRSSALEISDDKALTEWAQHEHLPIFAPPRPVISKTAIRELLEDGVEIPYSEIVERVSVIIK